MTVGKAQWYPSQGHLLMTFDEDGQMRIKKEMLGMVGFLCVYELDEYATIGTAFFIHITEGRHDFIYAVTCKHVIEPELAKGKTLFLRLNRADVLDVFHVPLKDEWVYHPDDTVDVAVLSLKADPSWHQLAMAPMAHTSLLSQTQMEDDAPLLAEGDDVVSLGLFAQYEGTRRTFPLARFGKVALVTDEPVMGWYGLSDYIFIEGQVYPGFSGSPVFVAHQVLDTNRFHLLLMGIAHGFFKEVEDSRIKTGDFVLDGKGGATVRRFTHHGISLVTPDTKIADILYGEQFMKAREERRGAWLIKNAATPAAT